MAESRLFQHTRFLIDQARMQGVQPIAFAMSRETMVKVQEEFAVSELLSLSLLQRWVRRFLLQQPSVALTSLHGLPVMENPHLPAGAIMLQVSGVPNLANAPTAPKPESVNPFQEQVTESKPAEEGVSIDSLARASQLTPSDVMMKGFENIERVEHVLVIRKYPNGDVDLCASCNPMEAVGIVQKAQMWLHMNG